MIRHAVVVLRYPEGLDIYSLETPRDDNLLWGLFDSRHFSAFYWCKNAADKAYIVDRIKGSGSPFVLGRVS